MRKHKLLAVLLALAMTLSILPATALADEPEPVVAAAWGEDYESATEFTISTKEELLAFAGKVNSGSNFSGKTVTLMNNIDLGNDTWTPIGTINPNATPVNPFSGHFDGGNHTISGVKITANSENYYGFFTHLYNGAKVENLNLTVTIDVTAPAWVGGLAGRADGSTIENCTVSGSIEGSGNGGSSGVGAAGVVEYAADSTLTDCISNVEIDVSSGDASLYAGGIVCEANNSTISKCINRGDVSGCNTGSSYSYVGGIATYVKNGSTVIGCANSGDVTSGNEDAVYATAGGVLGQIWVAAPGTITVKGCKNFGTITARGGTNTGYDDNGKWS